MSGESRESVHSGECREGRVEWVDSEKVKERENSKSGENSKSREKE